MFSINKAPKSFTGYMLWQYLKGFDPTCLYQFNFVRFRCEAIDHLKSTIS